mmetsp:Transcript_97232/g.275080  ORF Transcript_97232/g.275080 Transcript_97232/m.275080 type:complete len:283 (+) Transcript_97232:416-1264(+)
MRFDLLGHDSFMQAFSLFLRLGLDLLFGDGLERHPHDLARLPLRPPVLAGCSSHRACRVGACACCSRSCGRGNCGTRDVAIDGNERLADILHVTRLAAAHLVVEVPHHDKLLDLRMDPLFVLDHDLPLVPLLLLKRSIACPGVYLHLKHGPLSVFEHLPELRHNHTLVRVLALAQLLADLEAVAVLKVGRDLFLQRFVVVVPSEGGWFLALPFTEKGAVVQVVDGVTGVHDGLPATFQSEAHGPEGLQKCITRKADERYEAPASPRPLLLSVIVSWRQVEGD